MSGTPEREGSIVLGDGRRLAWSEWGPIDGRVVVLLQVACSFVLLTSAALFVRSVRAAGALDLRLDPSGVVVATLNTDAYGYDEAASRAFYERLREGFNDIFLTLGVDGNPDQSVLTASAAGSNRRRRSNASVTGRWSR